MPDKECPDQNDIFAGGNQPSAITRLDEKGDIVYANSRAERIFAQEKFEITDRAYDGFEWQITSAEGKGEKFDPKVTAIPVKMIETGNLEFGGKQRRATNDTIFY